MSLSQAANLVERAAGHDKNAVTQQDVSNYEEEDSSSETMRALVWVGKNKVELANVSNPKIIEDGDAVLKVTGSTICGSDLHLLHGVIAQLSKGDIFGHEFCGIVEQVGSGVKRIQKGSRYVASFQIACGACFFCKQKLSSQCEKTNANITEHAMYGGKTAGMFGYAHFTGGFAGGQAEYVRVPLADVNLLEIPDDVPDEKAHRIIALKILLYYPKDEVAIFGAGPIGQMAGVFAVGEGAQKVIFVDRATPWICEKALWSKRQV